jgi:hypothetical protein
MLIVSFARLTKNLFQKENDRFLFGSVISSNTVKDQTLHKESILQKAETGVE